MEKAILLRMLNKSENRIISRNIKGNILQIYIMSYNVYFQKS